MLREKICKDTVGDAYGMKERYEGIDGLKAYAILGIDFNAYLDKW